MVWVPRQSGLQPHPGHKDTESSRQVTSYCSCFWKAQATSQMVGVSACLALSLVGQLRKDARDETMNTRPGRRESQACSPLGHAARRDHSAGHREHLHPEAPGLWVLWPQNAPWTERCYMPCNSGTGDDGVWRTAGKGRPLGMRHATETWPAAVVAVPR